jgi:TolB-like protein/tetratricopeptide (TPR) repeat protein
MSVNPSQQSTSESGASMGSLAARLQSRKVVQWTMAYLAGSWLVLQVLSLLGETFAWPSVLQRVVTVLLGVGLLAVVVLSWYHGEKGAQRVTATEFAMLFGIFVLAGAAVALVREGRGVADVEGTPGPDDAASLAQATSSDGASLAVLPLRNESPDPDNAYFASGIHDELLTQLSQIQGLRVISRTTMRRYENTQKTVPQVAQELGVSAVMEGSVHRAGNRVRITLQLIDPGTDDHLWAQSFDREITDIFAVQSEVAHAVASALQATLAPRVEAGLAHRPTENAEAYALYLRGVDYLRRSYSEEDLRTGGRMFQRAVALDPRFAEAWAWLSRAEGLLHWFGFEPTATQLARARTAAEEAYKLAPELPAARIGMSEVHYRAREYDRALEFAEPLVSELPGFAEAVSRLAGIYRRQGQWIEALQLFERQVELDPANGLALYELGVTYNALHRFADAEAVLNRSIELAPDDSPNSYLELGWSYFWRGDLKSARDVVVRIPGRFAAERALTLAWFDAAEGRYQDGLDRLGTVPAGARAGARGIAMEGSPKELIEGFLLDRLGRAAEARSRYRTAADAVEAIVAAEGFDVRGQVPYRTALAAAYAGLGLKAQAIATAEQSVRELPVSLDAFSGPRRLIDAAKVYATVGEKDRAVAALEQALSTPTDATPASLRLDPLLESLRGYPPFERLMREKEPR